MLIPQQKLILHVHVLVIYNHIFKLNHLRELSNGISSHKNVIYVSSWEKGHPLPLRERPMTDSWNS